MSKQKASKRLLISLLAGCVAAAITVSVGRLYFTPLAAWDVAAVIFLIQVWPKLWPLNGKQTREHAIAEDPSRATAHSLVLLAATASLGAAGLVLVKHGTSSEQAVLALVTIASIVLSWAVIHTLYALHYAVIYYSSPEGGVDFNQDNPPTYADFAYLAFTIGMTYQVSDTAFANRKFRTAALVHALFSFLFGTIIIATTINLVAGLGK